MIIEAPVFGLNDAAWRNAGETSVREDQSSLLRARVDSQFVEDLSVAVQEKGVRLHGGLPNLKVGRQIRSAPLHRNKDHEE